MSRPAGGSPPLEPFEEKDFYLEEFRGRSVLLALAPAATGGGPRARGVLDGRAGAAGLGRAAGAPRTAGGGRTPPRRRGRAPGGGAREGGFDLRGWPMPPDSGTR